MQSNRLHVRVGTMAYPIGHQGRGVEAVLSNSREPTLCVRAEEVDRSAY